MAVGLHRCPPIFGSSHHQARRLALLIPRVNEAREWLIGRAVIPERMKTLHHEYWQRVVNLGQPALDPRPPGLSELGRIAPDPKAPARIIRPAVIGQDSAAARAFPPKYIRALHGRSTEVRVDGHGETFDPEIEQ